MTALWRRCVSGIGACCRRALCGRAAGSIAATPCPSSDGRGAQVGCGIVNYSAADIAAIKGHHSHDISDILDYNYGDYIVHRNNMVIV